MSKEYVLGELWTSSVVIPRFLAACSYISMLVLFFFTGVVIACDDAYDEKLCQVLLIIRCVLQWQKSVIL